MSKDMSTILDELRNATAAINAAVEKLAKLEADAKQETPEPTQAKEPALTLEDVRAVLAEKSRAGFTAQIQALLLKYNADKLSHVDPSDYEALIADAELLNDDAY